MAKPKLATILADIEQAEAAGFDSYWLAQTGLVDALGVLALAGERTSRIRLGTAVIPTWPRHPQALAAQALTTAAATSGRLILGIGLAHQPTVEERWKMTWERPIRHMNEYLDVLLPLMEDGESEAHGTFWSYEGEFERPVDHAPPVMLAALGDQMLRIAGRRSEGTILWCVGPKTLSDQIVPKIGAAAEQAGRSQPSVVCSLPVWVTDQPDNARAAINKMLARYAELPSYRAMLDIEAAQGVGDIALVGSEAEVAEGLAQLAAAGATDFTAVMPSPDPVERERAIAALAGY